MPNQAITMPRASKRLRSKLKKVNPNADKMEKTMHEFKTGTLHSGSKQGPKVTDRKQAIAIALSQARKKAFGR